MSLKPSSPTSKYSPMSEGHHIVELSHHGEQTIGSPLDMQIGRSRRFTSLSGRHIVVLMSEGGGVFGGCASRSARISAAPVCHILGKVLFREPSSQAIPRTTKHFQASRPPISNLHANTRGSSRLQCTLLEGHGKSLFTTLGTLATTEADGQAQNGVATQISLGVGLLVKAAETIGQGC